MVGTSYICIQWTFKYYKGVAHFQLHVYLVQSYNIYIFYAQLTREHVSQIQYGEHG
jgi:hypothetical protein